MTRIILAPEWIESGNYFSRHWVERGCQGFMLGRQVRADHGWLNVNGGGPPIKLGDPESRHLRDVLFEWFGAPEVPSPAEAFHRHCDHCEGCASGPANACYEGMILLRRFAAAQPAGGFDRAVAEGLKRGHPQTFEAARETEREACARLVELLAPQGDNMLQMEIRERHEAIARAIRARGSQEEPKP